VPTHLVEEAREAGWTDEQIIEAVAEMALAQFQSLFAAAAELPLESSDPAVLQSADQAA
jgi:alkylhydroperoxidase family enzyme